LSGTIPEDKEQFIRAEMGSTIVPIVAFKIIIGTPSTAQLVFDSNFVTMLTILKGVVGRKNMKFLFGCLR